MENKKNILITGATGMVGSEVLELLLNDKTVGKVISIGRRKIGNKIHKLEEIVHTDFLDFSGLASKLTNIDICFYCLGVYQNQVTKEEFFKITCHYQKALTNVLQLSSPNARFVLFGATGADTTEKSRVTFSKAKGIAENLLNETIFPKKFIFRPGYIHPSGKRKPEGLAYKLVLPIAGLFYKLFSAVGISSADLAKVMVNVGLNPQSESRVFEANEIKKLSAKYKTGQN